MKLGDLFWVKTLKLKSGDYRFDDSIRIIGVVKESFGYELSFVEAIYFWEIFSNSRCAGWLYINNDQEIIDAFEYFIGEEED